MKKIQSAINRLRNCMNSPVIDCRELSRLIDELQHQTPADAVDVDHNQQETFQGGAR